MPRPRLPLVRFRFSGSDEPAYAIVLREGDNALDLGVFAPNHGRMQQKDGVRHLDDPDLQRMAEFIPGVWEEMPEVSDVFARLEALEEAYHILASSLAGASGDD